MKAYLDQLKNSISSGNYLKNRQVRLALLALAFTLAFCVFVTATLFAGSSYVPEDTVQDLNFERSQVYVDGAGYVLDSYTKKEHEEQEEQRQEIIEEEPPKQETPQTTPTQPTSPGLRTYPRSYTPTYRPPTSQTPTTPQKKPEKPKKEKKSEYEKKKEEASEDPVIKISGIKNNATVKGTEKKFTVKATSYDGDEITGSKLTVKMNGVKLTPNDDNKYVGEVIDGSNKIEVKAVDESGNSAKKTVKFKGVTDAEPEEIGELDVVVTADALGLDTVVEEKSVKIYDNEQLSDVVKRYFDSFSDVKAEDIGSGYYEIGRIKKDGILDDIPDNVIEDLEEMGITPPDNKNSLGLNDFGPGSGWMYSVDGNSPSKYMSSMDPKDGSLVEIYYTVSGM
ncbi:MAG: DUF4430 domain-containing protein [Eubacterium sp.]|nr:DUF4430 domain-containing protein [Eubacterium sp.]